MNKKDTYIQSAQQMAERVFENKNDAQTWLSTPNFALGGNTPLEHCQTELGLRQVRRILASIEFGGVV
ncbi:MbcA/ParS/Xre antitoxin family protein [Pollutimonas harenae]|uniref:DUF2384 domain-containing protein n=1 Tax=Pollutimonas harenae TaxID=657015 RepID=A0A853GY30_9BURK|nr:MbcA/ParS/Xre antitoxin family protein [Pollutimonas harenae]NYT85022.1 DUF2384 domain-containing protein [Pollutimonas harenae]TEA72592.1 DUF2384 domain-containing protein [Pollutimonas harenae]